MEIDEDPLAICRRSVAGSLNERSWTNELKDIIVHSSGDVFLIFDYDCRGRLTRRKKDNRMVLVEDVNFKSNEVRSKCGKLAVPQGADTRNIQKYF